jgi:hypothetical protein
VFRKKVDLNSLSRAVHSDIRHEFQDITSSLPAIRLRGEEENDQIRQEIDLVIEVRVNKLSKDLQLTTETKNQVQQKLLMMQHRTYLWLYLSIKGIYQAYHDSLRLDEEIIETLPSSVEDAYEKILSKVTDKQRDIVAKILQIIVGARRPLTLKEMSVALGFATAQKQEVSEDVIINSTHLEQHIRHWCGLFVFTNHSRIYLIHQTAPYTIAKTDLTKCLFRFQT